MSKMLIRAAALMSLLTLLVAGPAVAVAPAEAENTAGPDKCIEQAYAMYNSCLMSSETIWGRMLCDVAFQLNIVTCGKS